MNPKTNLEVGQEYDTAVGRVRVLSTTSPAPGGHIILEDVDSGKLSRTHTAEGFTPVPRKFKFQVWLNVCRTSIGYKVEGLPWCSSILAEHNSFSLKNRIALVCVDIEGTEGDGLIKESLP